MLTCTQNQCFEQNYEKISKFFYRKFSIFVNEETPVITWACFYFNIISEQVIVKVVDSVTEMKLVECEAALEQSNVN